MRLFIALVKVYTKLKSSVLIYNGKLYTVTGRQDMSGFIFRHFAKNSGRTKTQVLDKTQVFFKKIRSQKRKKIPQPQKLGFGNFQKLRLIFVKLRSVLKKLRSEISKNIPQPQIDINKGAGKVSKKKPEYGHRWKANKIALLLM